MDTRQAGDGPPVANVGAAAGPADRDAPATEIRGMRRQLEARRHHDVIDRLSAITAPVLVTAGRYDGIAPLANSEAIVSQLPDARLAVFEGGHAFLAQDFSSWSVIAEFLDEGRPPTVS